MSYESENILKEGTTLRRVFAFLKMLNYENSRGDTTDQDAARTMYWIDNSDYKSYVGITLKIYKKDNQITVTTRSGASRSYWDLLHQNKTIKLLKEIFGGIFKTDAGMNRLYRPDTNPPTPLASGCYLARWIFHNAIIRARVYLDNRDLNPKIAKDKPSGFTFLDEINPRLLSNNMLIPYIIASWEEYFKSTFTAVLRYTPQRAQVFKKVRLTAEALEQIASSSTTVERAVADAFSFQRPSAICENFKMLNQGIDLYRPFNEPYKRRKETLFTKIERIVEARNTFVHSGEMDLSLFDKSLNCDLQDFEAAIDRVYKHIAKYYNFKPIRGY